MNTEITKIAMEAVLLSMDPEIQGDHEKQFLLYTFNEELHRRVGREHAEQLIDQAVEAITLLGG